MATSLLFTGSSFATLTTVNSTATTTILPSDSTYDRRIYGISQTQASATASTATVLLNNGSSNFSIGLGPAAGTSINVTTDIFGNSTLAPVFQKQKDANGVPYFNLPTGWSILVTQTTNATINYLVFGEKYN